MNVYINIETVPGQPAKRPEDFEPPSNYRDPEKIAAWRVEKADKDYYDQATDAFRASIYCVTLLVDNELEPIMLVDHEGHEEARLMGTLERELDSLDRQSSVPLTYISFNGFGFDYIFLRTHAAKHGLSNLAERFAAGKWGSPYHRDILVELGEEGTLDEWAHFFGISEPKNPCTGGDLMRAWVRGHASRARLLNGHTATRVLWLRDIDRRLGAPPRRR